MNQNADQSFFARCPPWYQKMILKRHEDQKQDLIEAINEGCDKLGNTHKVRVEMLATVKHEDRIGISQTINVKRMRLRGM